MSNQLIMFCAIVTAVSLGSTPAFAGSKKLKLLSAQTKITMKRAEKIALAKAPGRTEEIELERNKDGKLVFSVEIEQVTGKKLEVEIDAISGQVLRTDEDNVDDKVEDKSEKKSEK